eukprot:6340735-Prymnesium_polylepis.2
MAAQTPPTITRMRPVAIPSVRPDSSGAGGAGGGGGDGAMVSALRRNESAHCGGSRSELEQSHDQPLWSTKASEQPARCVRACRGERHERER